MYVAAGACSALLKGEREKFIETEWPRIRATIQRLGLTVADLQALPATRPAADDAPGLTPTDGDST